MNKTFTYKFLLFIAIGMLFCIPIVLAQVPKISYGSAKTFIANLPISPVTPTNSGGATSYGTLTNVKTFSYGGNITGLAVDSAKNFYLIDAYAHTIKKVDAKTGITTDFATNLLSNYITADKKGNIYSIYGFNGYVTKIATGTGRVSQIGTGLSTVTNIAVDGSGSVFLSDNFNTIKKISAIDGATTTIASNFDSINGIAVDAEGNIYVVEYGKLFIKKISAIDHSISLIPVNFQFQQGITSDAAGNLYLYDPYKYALKRVSAVDHSISTAASQVFPSYGGMQTDMDGNLYIAFNSFAIQKITLNCYTIKPTLPNGLNFDVSTGTVSGTPRVKTAATNYVVIAYNSSGSGSANLNIGINNASLADLTVSNATLYPAFTTDKRVYTDTVKYEVSSLKLTPSSNDSTAIIKVNSKVITSGKMTDIPLVIGQNIINILVTDAAKTTSLSYKLTISREAPSDASLKNLTLSKGLLSPVFSKNTTSYLTLLSSTTGSIKVTPATTDPLATIKVNGATIKTGTASASIALVDGPNAINIVVIAQNGEKSIYKLTVVRATAAPAISYSDPIKRYAVGTPITPIKPINTGGSVPAIMYGDLQPYATGLSTPTDIAADAFGNIYVENAQSSLIQKVSAPDGSITNLASEKKYQSGLITTDPLGNAYSIQLASGDGTITCVAAANNAITYIKTGLKAPSAIAADGAGNVYVSDNIKGELEKISLTNGSMKSIGKFSWITALTSDPSGNLYIIASAGNTVYELKKLDVKTNKISLIADNLTWPNNITVDALGNIFVTQSANNVIKKITSAGVVNLFAVTSSFLSGITTDRKGNLYITDGQTGIRKASTNGYSISPALPQGLYFHSPSGTISGTPLEGGTATYTITAYNNGGSSSTKLTMAIALPPKPVLSYTGPNTFTVTETIDNLIPTAQNIAEPGYSATPKIFATGFNTPRALTMDASGNMYISDSGTSLNIKKVALGQTKAVVWATGLPTLSADPIAVDAAGNVYMTDITNKTALLKYHSGTVKPDTVAKNFKYPNGVAIDGVGNLYVFDAGIYGVVKVAKNGTKTNLNINVYDIVGTVDAAGNLYVANPNDHYVAKIAAGSTTKTMLTTTIVRPGNMTVDASGNLFVLDLANAAILKIAQGKKPVTVVSGLINPTNIFVDKEDNLYVTRAYDGTVVKYTLSGGYYITPALPPGITINNQTGVIGGKPTTISPAKNYTVTAYNSGGNVKATVSIKVASDTRLSALVLDAGNLKPAFDYRITNYTLQIGNSVSGITITPTAWAKTSTIKVNGIAVVSGKPSAIIPLTVGNNTINTIVTGTDGTTKTYTVNIKKDAGSNANLASLTFSQVKLNPLFDTDIINYSSSVADYIKTTTITYTPSDSSSVVTINGTLYKGNTCNFLLVPGFNTITILVTSKDAKTKKAYTVKLTKPKLIQTIKFITNAINYGHADFIAATTSSGLPLTFHSSDEHIATIVNGKLHIVSAGLIHLSVQQTGNAVYAPSIVKTTIFTINKATLTIKADNKTKKAGDENPILTTTITGFVNNDDKTKLVTQPKLTTTATASSEPGVYPITVSGAVSTNYAFNYVTGELTVSAASNITASKTLIVSKAMSPNGDGVNDVLNIEGIGNYPDNRVNIMDVNGNTVYNVVGYNNQNRVFDGHSTKNRAMQKPGTYYYVLEYKDGNNEAKQLTGFFLIKY
ncbi:T9SS type B sorting domain-containing protein [Inquilinus sp. KBS0705]|nr:T9SS type B sorting domain-containing protein [Inquilinus sp. KBS0705]